MNPEQIANLVGLAIAAYPNMQNKLAGPIAEVWRMTLADLSYDVARQALAAHIATSRFFPTVADIREQAVRLTQPRALDWLEAWGLVMDAVRRHGSYHEQAALASLPADVAETARRIGWREICLCEEPGVVRGQFRMAWETVAKRHAELAVLPEPLRAQLEAVAARLALPSGDEL